MKKPIQTIKDKFAEVRIKTYNYVANLFICTARVYDSSENAKNITKKVYNKDGNFFIIK
jgi:hypothetical protein